MSKVASCAAVGVAGAGTAVSGAYMLGAFGDSTYLAKDLTKFKESGGGTCAKSLFPGLSLNTEGKNQIGSSDKISLNSFDSSDGEDIPVESCLIVNWDRNDYQVTSSEKKWSGNLRWSWSFRNKKGDKGFVMFALAQSNGGSTKQLDLTGGFYYVSKDSTNKLWTLEKYSELETSATNVKKINKDNFDTAFPSVGDGFLDGELKKQTNWGFVSDKSEFDKICPNDSECAEDKLSSSKSFRNYWTWEKDSALNSSKHDLSKWSKNFDGWLSNMYDKTTKLDLSTLFTSIKGDWK